MAPTIYALSSGRGRSGVAVVRASGSQSHRVLRSLTRVPNGFSFEPRRVYLRGLYDAHGEVIDHALVVFFRKPNSFTGEDVVELHLHGSPAVIKKTLDYLAQFGGLRLAEPGEFMRQAFENGKMTLLDVEAVSDLIQAETDSQHRQAMRQMHGDVGKYYAEWRDGLLKSLSIIEAAIDFSEDEHLGFEEVLSRNVHSLLIEIASKIEQSLKRSRMSERIRSGIKVAIVGAPNVGKSSILNALAGLPAAIVSPVAGTTRDIVEVRLNVGGFYVVAQDTAGLSDLDSLSGSTEPHLRTLNEESIRRSICCAKEADIRVFVSAVDQPGLSQACHSLIQQGDLFVLNKVDLVGREERRKSSLGISFKGQEVIHSSMKTGSGLDELFSALGRAVKGVVEGDCASVESATVTRVRHRQHLQRCLSLVRQATHTLVEGGGIELVAESLRSAVREISCILMGSHDIEDVLDRIFSEFCIGK